MARVRTVKVAPGVSGEDLSGKMVRTFMPQGTRAQIAKRRQGWASGGELEKRRAKRYEELGL